MFRCLKVDIQYAHEDTRGRGKIGLFREHFQGKILSGRGEQRRGNGL